MLPPALTVVGGCIVVVGRRFNSVAVSATEVIFTDAEAELPSPLTDQVAHTLLYRLDLAYDVIDTDDADSIKLARSAAP
jgi:hypothetical protein